MNFLRFARGIEDTFDWPETSLNHDSAEFGLSQRRWIPLRNLERDTHPDAPKPQPQYQRNKNDVFREAVLGQIGLNAPPSISGNREDRSKSSLAEALPSWACDWRMQGVRTKVDHPHFMSNETFFDVRKDVSPPRQSIHDFGKRLVFRGCALARAGCDPRAPTAFDGRSLGNFSRLPACTLQKGLDQSSGTTNGKATYNSRQLLLFRNVVADQNPPCSNMVVLLLRTMLHDQAECDCAVDDANITATGLQKEKTPSETSPNFLRAYCPYDKYPRSYVQNLDWLFLLDGLDEPVILRPHIAPGIVDTTRSEVGFDFVSVCPLRVAGEREKWAEAPCAYGESVLF